MGLERTDPSGPGPASSFCTTWTAERLVSSWRGARPEWGDVSVGGDTWAWGPGGEMLPSRVLVTGACLLCEPTSSYALMICATQKHNLGPDDAKHRKHVLCDSFDAKFEIRPN